ncbi:hypothetical protein V6N12_042400 [Hibiscus sabdariffa]|uniref:Uncharacterized protein n=1 Tax=Hibiscus sabdariffa TaxID=183260 RepID=A0ABR2EEP4_9ROSI
MAPKTKHPHFSVSSSSDPINAKSLRKSKFHLVNGEWIRDPNVQEKGDGEEAQVPPMAAPQVSVELIQGLFQDLNANINTRFTSMEARMSAFETYFKIQEDRMTCMERNLDAFHLEWRTKNFDGTSGGDDEDEDDDDSLTPQFIHAYHII